MPRSRSLRFAAALFGATQLLAADGPCAAPATVAAEIDAITSRWNIDVDSTQKNRTEALCALAGRMPRDVEAQVACQDARAIGQEGLDAERQRARRAHETDPDSPLAWFLWARVLPDDEAVRTVDSLVAKYPEFPWGHLRKASLAARRKGPADQEALRSSLARFSELCPESTAAYRYVSAVADVTFVRSSAARLRERLQRNPSPVLAYWTLWQLEFKAEPASGHEAIRARVRADLARLEPSLHKDPDKASILLEGHALLGDPVARAATEDRILASIPGTYVAFGIELSRFERLHPGWEPKATFEASTDWIRRWPDYSTPWVYRLGALRGTSGVSDDEAIRTGEGLLRALRLRPLDISSIRRPFPIQVAELWVSRGVRLRDVIFLANQVVEDTDRYLRARALYTPKDRADLLDEVRWLGKPLRVEALASTGRREAAVRVLAEMESTSATPAGDPDPLVIASRRSMLERARAGFALADGNTQEALAHYRNAVRSFEGDSRAMPEPREALRRAKLLLPASDDESIDRWLAGGEGGSRAVSVVAFERRDRMLPHTSLRTIDGSTSSIPDPKRRTLVAVIWATWCGPCRDELPFVQALHEKLGSSGSATLVTLSVDDNPGLIAPFLRERRFTFPVLLAKDYVGSLPEQSLSVPRTWIVSPDGRVVFESAGFVAGETLESWLRRVEAAVASATGSGGS